MMCNDIHCSVFKSFVCYTLSKNLILIFVEANNTPLECASETACSVFTCCGGGYFYLKDHLLLNQPFPRPGSGECMVPMAPRTFQRIPNMKPHSISLE